MKKYLRSVAAASIVICTIAAFVRYISAHPALRHQLQRLSVSTLALLFGLYCLVFLLLSVVSRASLDLYGKRITPKENMLFNAYSSLVNFFGPGQSGPVFRGAYLRKRHNLGLKQYVFATLLYYGFFAVFSTFLMLAGTCPWWQTAGLMCTTGVLSGGVIRWYKRRAGLQQIRPTVSAIAWIGMATALQVALMVAIYSVELHSVAVKASLGQVMSYTGVANLALFAALTPGAIGIREGFLLFSQRLHHITSSAIVAANVVDRGVYLLFLGLLFILVISMHAKQKLQVTQTNTDTHLKKP